MSDATAPETPPQPIRPQPDPDPAVTPDQRVEQPGDQVPGPEVEGDALVAEQAPVIDAAMPEHEQDRPVAGDLPEPSQSDVDAGAAGQPAPAQDALAIETGDVPADVPSDGPPDASADSPSDTPTAAAPPEPAASEPATTTTEAAPTSTAAATDPPPQPDVPPPSRTPAPVGVPSPAALAVRHAPPTGPSPSAAFGRVTEDGTVYVRTPEGEREVGSYPGATPAEALAYFTRKYDETHAAADLLLQRVTQTDLSTRDATDALAKLREQSSDLRAVGDLVALAAKVENIATALDARKAVESQERSAAREVAKARREEIVTEAEALAGQPEHKIQWKVSSARMRALLEEWKEAQRQGPKLDRESEQALWHRLSSARNSFDKLRRVHFAQLSGEQAEAKSAKQQLVAEAQELARSTEWGATAGAFKRLMDRWRQAGRASRSDDDALWAQFKAAQDSFFTAKDAVAASENQEYAANLAVKEQLLTQAQALLPVKDLDATKAALRVIQDKWDAAGKVPRADMERIEKGMRRVEAQVREASDRKWASSNPEVSARAQSMVAQLESAIAGLRQDLAKAETSRNRSQIAKARDALTAREAWLEQARRGLG